MILRQGTGTRILPIGGGISVVQPRGGAYPWYNPAGAFSAFLTDIYAWRAKGAASYAASKVDECQGASLSEGNGAVPWAGGTGWGFVAAAAQWLDTGLVPLNTNWSLFIQFGGAFPAGNEVIAGCFSPPQRFWISHDDAVGGGANVRYRNGGILDTAPALGGGNLGFGGLQGYRNGIFDGIIPAGNTPAFSIYIGGLNTAGVMTNPATVNIAAVWICRSNPATVQANALALVTAMAAL